jgi:hypothetical protein
MLAGLLISTDTDGRRCQEKSADRPGAGSPDDEAWDLHQSGPVILRRSQ